MAVLALVLTSVVQLSQADRVALAADASCTTLVSGLDSPRYAVLTGDGGLIVTEAGTGNTETIEPPAGSPPDAEPIVRGLNGKVQRISSTGEKTLLVDKLPSYGPTGDNVGPAGIVVANGFIYVAVTGNINVPNPLANEDAVLKINMQTGEIIKLADIAAFEKTNNPQAGVPHPLDSDPYGMDMGPDGNLYVANAGGNDIYQVNPNTGDIKLVALLAGLPGPFPNPERGGKMELDPVPTDITTGPDGNLYVGLLTGGPFPVGAAKVLKVTPGGTVTDFATGLTAVTGVAFGPDKLLYVSEIFNGGDFTQNPPKFNPGRVVRIKADGTQEVILSNVSFPNGLNIDAAGNLFVLTGTNLPNGSIMRCAGVAAAPTTPTPPTLPNTGPADSILFPVTGFRLDGAILQYWLANGGLSIFGYPIDSARQENGQVYQWLERNRIELHPEKAAPYNVLLGRLGVESLARRGINWDTLPKVSSAPAGCQYFAETGHSLCGNFLNYWQSNGLKFEGSTGQTPAESLALFGYPISEPTMETNSSGDTVLTQWFERARFEYHPNNPAQFQVLLGRLGAELK
jgi:sugar lactone lactonase YvrE